MSLSRLVVARHGRAGTAPTDGERRLTEEGRAGVERVAAALKSQGIAGPVVLCSPLVRAVETAEILAGATSGAPPRADARLEPGAEPSALMEAAREAGAPHVILVGHMPDLGILAGSLIGASSFHLSAGAALVFAVKDNGTSELQAVLDPEDA